MGFIGLTKHFALLWLGLGFIIANLYILKDSLPNFTILYVPNYDVLSFIFRNFTIEWKNMKLLQVQL